MNQTERSKFYLKDIDFLLALGKRMQSLRKDKGFSQELLANTIGVEISQISRLERGISNVSISLIKKIADALDLTLSEVFDFEYNH